MLKTDSINIRDPFVLSENGRYYLFGTRAKTCWGEADGFDGYVSVDLENWEGPTEIFHRPEGFWADKNYWAPECHHIGDAYYLFATFNSVAEEMKGTMILKASSPLGPYELWSEGKITPPEWNCLDGTFYRSPSGKPYMVFSHEWVDLGDGEICAVELSEDLKRPAGEPWTLFRASEGKPWVRSIRHRSRKDPIFVTDGPFLYRTSDGQLLLLWSSFDDKGYAQAIARSDNGDIDGSWRIDEAPLFAENGGHGMLFVTREGRLFLTLHQPNETPLEHPIFLDVTERIDSKRSLVRRERDS